MIYNFAKPIDASHYVAAFGDAVGFDLISCEEGVYVFSLIGSDGATGPVNGLNALNASPENAPKDIAKLITNLALE